MEFSASSTSSAAGHDVPPRGTPARVSLSVASRIPDAAPAAREPAPESADKTKRRVSSVAKRLADCAREYDSVNEWVRIAEANDLTIRARFSRRLAAAPQSSTRWNGDVRETYANFYAPAFAVAWPQRLQRDLLLAISQIEVDLVLVRRRTSPSRSRLLRPSCTHSRPARRRCAQPADVRHRGGGVHGLRRRQIHAHA